MWGTAAHANTLGITSSYETTDKIDEPLSAQPLESMSFPTLRFDGASKGNPGPAGGGAVLFGLDGAPQWALGVPLGRATNNQAEYTGLLEGLKEASKRGIKDLLVEGDSKLVIEQLKGGWKVRDAGMKRLFDECKTVLKGFSYVVFTHIPREQNQEADHAANEGVKGHFVRSYTTL